MPEFETHARDESGCIAGFSLPRVKEEKRGLRRWRVQRSSKSLDRTMRILTVASSAGADLKLRTVLRLGRRSAVGAVGAIFAAVGLGLVGVLCGGA